jgi:phosphoribosylformimino-5-aminoimidazole carboxamide ribotide isomerase
MLIPSIDLMNGRIVQLVQGERLALETDAIDEWIGRFRDWPKVQLIDSRCGQESRSERRPGRQDLHRASLPRRRRDPFRRARGERHRRGSDPCHRRFGACSRRADRHGFAETLARPSGRPLIAAVDSKAGHVVIDAWRTSLPLTAVDAMRQLEPFFGGFLIPTSTAKGSCRAPTWRRSGGTRRHSREVIAAGGITTMEEVDELDRMGVDAVVGWRCIRAV